MPNCLRRSCGGCVKAKRRCDLALPRCGRCAMKGIACTYLNVPLAPVAERTVDNNSIVRRDRSNLVSSKPSVLWTPEVEVIKVHQPTTVQFLINRIREFPIVFAQTMKTSFIHSGLYESSMPAPIKELHTICMLYACITNGCPVPSMDLERILRSKSAELSRQAGNPSTFAEMLACVQALILIQCIYISRDDGRPHHDSANPSCDQLLNLARRLWEMAPNQLPHELNPYHAWLFAENVRRTIIMAFILCSTSSLKTRNYSIRTPFVDALPFDIRTSLWDETCPESWEKMAHRTPASMVSVHEYTGMLEDGLIHEGSSFGILIWAACRGLPSSDSQELIPSPP